MKISIVTVTLNAERFLRNTIESVRGQEYADYEHLIIDGCSSDRTVEIAGEYAADDPRLRVYIEPDGGIADAMNKRGRLASGDVVAFLHADDLYADRKVLSRVAAVFEATPGATWCTGGMRHVDAQGRRRSEFAPRRYSFRRLLRGNIIYHPATFVWREALLSAGGFAADLHYAMDYDLWLRLGRIAPPVILPDILACFRVHDGSVSCQHASETVTEEWQIRRGYLAPGSAGYYLHYWYFLLKRAVQERMAMRYLRNEEAEHA